jgi:L-threonylcarbamoyladenylate synthase
VVTPELIAQAAELIRRGRLVAFPTETVYGLGANALDPEAVRRIFEAKGRPSTSPLIVHVASVEMARSLAASWPEQAAALASSFWPGPLTLVVPKAPEIPDIVTADLHTVGLRMPAHPVALALIRAADVPIAAPSANRFTQLSPTTAGHVRAGLGSAVDLILDGGPTRVGIESTVLSLCGAQPVLLRPGMVTREDIERIVGPVSVLTQAGAGSHPSPGMHTRHYSPRTPIALITDGKLPANGRGVHVGFGAPAQVSMPREPAAYAAVLYSTLHRLDTEGWDWIAIERPPDGSEWAGVRDRLERAAAK